MSKVWRHVNADYGDIEPVDQKGPLDCLTACLATLTGVPHEDFPLPPESKELSAHTEYQGRVQTFLLSRGWLLATCWRRTPFGYSVAAGPSPRDPTISHCVVMLGGSLLHDPHPSRSGIASVTEYQVLIPLAASREEDTP